MKARSRFRLLAVVLPALIILAAAQPAIAQPGRISGRVTEAKTGSPLPYANVVVVGTNMGGMTLTDGTFSIIGVPVGTYTIKVMMMGYAPSDKTGIKVDTGQTTKVDFKLEEQIVGKTQEIVVEAEQVQIDVKSSDVKHSVSKDELEELPVDDVVEALALKGGIIKTGDELHVRGGRDGEVQFQIDGVPVDDPLGGGMISVGMLGTDDSQVITGGMDAEYGNAQSAIVNISTREGGRTFEGQVRYMTDDFGRKDKTYTNYDRFSLGFGGPTGLRNLTFYVSGEFTASDGENWAIWSRNDHMKGTPFENYGSFAQRQSEQYNVQGKLAWQVKPGMKLIGEAIISHSRSHGFSNNWNVEGYVQKIYRFTTLRASRESLADDARAFGPYVSVYHGPWIEEELQRAPSYPGTLEGRRNSIYPITIFSKVRDPNNPDAGAFIIRYDNFYARLVENIYGEETEIIWEEMVVNADGQEDYQNK
ncbi:MAG: carboxypeptidase regulatory-like domain-containing protein, partial [Acidobacteriota bacterium]